MRTYLSIVSLVCFLMCTGNLCAQENLVKRLETYTPGEGKVSIKQDPKIEALLGAKSTSGAEALKIPGYRVQVYAGGNSRSSKMEAERVASKVKQLFPDLQIYTLFIPPRWLCRVGDFRSVEEADAMMRRLRNAGGFKEVSIVKDQIILF